MPENSDNFSIIWSWNSETEEIDLERSTEVYERWRERLHDINDKSTQESLLVYRQTVPPADASAQSGPPASEPEVKVPETEPSDWPSLTEFISADVLTRLVKSRGEEDWIISTTSCGPQDKENIPGLEGNWGSERELGFLQIDLKRTWREGAIGAERTKAARDRSWALDDLVEDPLDGAGWGKDLLGEMQICFLMCLLLANYSCLEQWKRILGLVLTCRDAITKRHDFFTKFLVVLKLQLAHCDDVEGGLFDVNASDAGGNHLKQLLRGFKRTLEEALPSQDNSIRKEMLVLEDWLREEWSWELSDSFLRKGIVELEDGERVELETQDLEGEDERGEYAPVIVDLEGLQKDRIAEGVE